MEFLSRAQFVTLMHKLGSAYNLHAAPFLLCSLVMSTHLVSLLDVCLYSRPKESLNLVKPVCPHFQSHLLLD